MNTGTPSVPPISAILASVGGTPKPILHILHKYRPKHVWYFCSAGSRARAEEIQAQLDWHPTPRFIEVERYEELGPCYCELRRKIPEILKETKVAPNEVLVDYTGGTKTMSAALVLAAVEIFQQFSYVGGEQREKAGLGIVVDGREYTLYLTNPWSSLAIREIERAKDLWNSCQFETVARLLQNTAPLVPHKLQFEAIALLAEAMAHRHHLNFGKAESNLRKLRGQIPLLFDGRRDYGLQDFIEQTHELCKQCQLESANNTLLRELLDNALRTARQGRFEDAAARLYRAMEMQGQIWLAEATHEAFINGRLKDRRMLPSQLADFEPCLRPDSQEIRLSLEQTFQALARLGHRRAQDIVTDMQSGRKNSRWRTATEKRNASILAHGNQPIGEDGFKEMKQIAADFLGFDLEKQANPIPPLEPAWLEAP
ncbi:TIGR02710 family CRISPR-associated CARF protein [Fontisphaera persica]|uniref:TIGR02710 family CRISPR-associated CARF protein n=1 Tax=Fontisphaera persica TaxID=2974023 RepID=UPI0024BF2595|nr:TIGR02710 family CRISPR-associated CARF protein [Fontisphaera persica]WCJ60668.1 TIGR02710 family CRISPR-associated CARF protein [Fontisphaera persica]